MSEETRDSIFVMQGSSQRGGTADARPCDLRRSICVLAMVAGIGSSLLLSGCEREKDRLDAEARRLCALDGGVKVYETVKLAEKEYEELLDRYGQLVIRSKHFAKPTDAFYQESTTTYLRSGNPELWRSEYRLVRRSDGKVLATSTHYTRRGGDFPGPWHESYFSCPDVKADLRLAELAIRKAD